jgi:hypothetical protein
MEGGDDEVLLKVSLMMTLYCQNTFAAVHVPNLVLPTVLTLFNLTKISGFGGLGVCMLASGTQDRGFAPDRSRLIFLLEKSTACRPSSNTTTTKYTIRTNIKRKNTRGCIILMQTYFNPRGELWNHTFTQYPLHEFEKFIIDRSNDVICRVVRFTKLPTNFKRVSLFFHRGTDTCAPSFVTRAATTNNYAHFYLCVPQRALVRHGFPLGSWCMTGNDIRTSRQRATEHNTLVLIIRQKSRKDTRWTYNYCETCIWR